MKILHIRFCNLNSLAGGWSIDLTRPEYRTDGIFAITGPTGAGKTTLLDAVCLALYGRTPRLKLISKTTNEIMTRHTGECWSEVEFATAKGTFRCHWSQHRARRSPAGELQQPRHEIVDAENGQPLETKIKQVALKVVEVTGMTYEQFTRSILLAQGDFNVFLQASPDDRAPILEQITGTEIYSRISRKVHERRNEEQSRFELLAHDCNGFTPLPEDQRDTLNARIVQLTDLARQRQQNIDRCRLILDTHARQEQLAKTIARQAEQLDTLDRQWQQMEPERLQLARARQARSIAPAYQRLRDAQQLQEEESGELIILRLGLEQISLQLQEVEAGQQQRVRQLAELKEQGRQLEATLRDVRRRDQQLQTFGEQRAILCRDRDQQVHELSETVKALATVEARMLDLQHQIGRITEIRQMSSGDRDLVEQYSAITVQLNHYLERISKRQALQSDLPRLEMQFGQVSALLADANASMAKLAAQDENLQAAEQSISARRRELLGNSTADQLYRQDGRYQQQLNLLSQSEEIHCRLEQLRLDFAGQQQRQAAAESRQATLLTSDRELSLQLKGQQEIVDRQRQIVLLTGKVRSYEQERQLLRDGVACPLCGATSHPFCRSTATAEVDEAQARLNHETIELSRLREHQLTIRSELAGTARELQLLTQGMEDQSREINRHDTLLARLLAELGMTTGNDLAGELSRRHQEVLAARNTLAQTIEELNRLQLHEQETATARKDAAEKLAKTEQQRQQLAADQLRGKEHLSRRHAELTGLDQEISRIQERLQTMISPFSSRPISPNTAPALLEHLAERKTAWQDNEMALARLSILIQECRAERDTGSTLQERLRLAVQQHSHQLEQLEQTLEQLRLERNALFGTDDPDTAEDHFRQRLTLEEELLGKLVEQLAILQQKRAAQAAQLASAEQRVAARAIHIEQQAAQFHQHLLAAEFADLESFLAHCLDDEAFGAIAEKTETLRQAMTETRTLLDSSVAALAGEEHRFPDPPSAEQAAGELSDLQQEYVEIQQETGALQQQLKNDELQRQRHAAKLAELAAQRLELERWSRLHELIGSSDGKKFRNFAQGLTFEMMIGHANLSLARMSDRYLLARDLREPLELHVIDNYQGGEIRSTKNLSGGESFIVSMALALGLSGMASHNVQVDSLFLDEGFGTLDEDALQTALDTLASLHHQGKLIGVISHVPGLRERIATQIRVTAGPGGISRLSGPGISTLREHPQ